jgi:4-hydroxybenzoate polyprenyltransferase
MLLVWPTLLAVWLAASGHPDGHTVGVFIVGAWLMRSAGCAINDWADRDFDRQVARTRDRPLASGQLYPVEALVLAMLLTVSAAMVLLTVSSSLEVWGLALLAVVVAGTYPFFKRFFAIPQAYLGVAFGFGIPNGLHDHSGVFASKRVVVNGG